MKILFASDTYYPHLNGVYYFVCRIGPLLQEKGHEVAVIAPSESVNFTLRKIDGFDVYGVPSLAVPFYRSVRIPIPISLQSRASQVLKQFQPDVIHIQDHFPIARAILNESRKLGIPVIGTNHFMTENLTSLFNSGKWNKRLENIMWFRFSSVFNGVSLVTTPSETAASLIRPKLNVEVVAVSSGVDLGKFNPYGDAEPVRKKYGIPELPVLLYVGRLDPEKHLEEVIEAARMTLDQVDFQLVIVGKGMRKSALEKLVRELGIGANVTFTGFVPDEDLPYLYKLSRCFVIASIAELLSLGTLQAMASGLPVIAVNAGALGELVHENENGFLFSPGDILAISRGIAGIFSDEGLYRKMREKSLEFIQKHDIHKTVDSFERIYQTSSVKETRKSLVAPKYLNI